jgi:GntR family transcriptional regulator, rspAB operon transcriptional repressor
MPPTDEGTITRELRTTGGPARSQVYAALRAGIVGAQFEPGRRLSENELALRLGVSRTPIREALVRLRDERLVEIVPQLGTFVTRISRRAVQDAQFVREALECAAVRRAAELASDEDIARLRDTIRRQQRTRESQDVDQFYALDDELHRALCELSGHELAWTLSQRAACHLNRIRRLLLPLPTYIADMIRQHEQIVDAVAAHDPGRAERVLRRHLRDVVANLPAIEQAHPRYFEPAT